jgi:hypothetical protein
MAYWLARIFALIGLVVPLAILVTVVAPEYLPSLKRIVGGPHESIPLITTSVSYLILLVTAPVASLAILLGWSADRRKLERLESEMEESGRQISN